MTEWALSAPAPRHSQNHLVISQTAVVPMLPIRARTTLLRALRFVRCRRAHAKTAAVSRRDTVTNPRRTCEGSLVRIRRTKAKAPIKRARVTIALAARDSIFIESTVPQLNTQQTCHPRRRSAPRKTPRLSPTPSRGEAQGRQPPMRQTSTWPRGSQSEKLYCASVHRNRSRV